MGEAEPSFNAVRQMIANTCDGAFDGADQDGFGEFFYQLISRPEIGQTVVADPFFGIPGQMAGLDELFDGLQDLDRGMPRDEAQKIERNRRRQERNEQEDLPSESVSAEFVAEAFVSRELVSKAFVS
ncbi:MAG: hypothetical protein P8010_15725 [Desulfosarcinaceae bacterium]